MFCDWLSLKIHEQEGILCRTLELFKKLYRIFCKMYIEETKTFLWGYDVPTSFSCSVAEHTQYSSLSVLYINV